MRLVVFAFDIPYPPTSGGRVDIWSQVCALAACGFEIQLWCLTGHDLDKTEDLVILNAGVKEVVCIKYGGYKGGLFRSLAKYLHFRPSCAGASAMRGMFLADVAARVNLFAPDLIVAHGIQTAGAVLSLLPHIKTVPWVYRSHNDEAAYYRALARAQPLGLKKYALWWQSIRLSWYEPWLCGLAGAVLHISKEEQARFSERGLTNQLWVPPVYDYKPPVGPLGATKWDVGILSSWFSSQKIEGLRWFLEMVRPLLPDGFKIAVAGSGAPSWLSGWCEELGVAFLGPVQSPQVFYSDCRCLVNPVLRGAGVNMKTMEMLSSGRPLVSTTAGLAGLPPEIGDWVDVCDTPEQFAESLISAVSLAERIVPASVFEPFTVDALAEHYRTAAVLAGAHVTR
jgi:polysaccharide biosynthesis protein PslH